MNSKILQLHNCASTFKVQAAGLFKSRLRREAARYQEGSFFPPEQSQF